MSSAAYELSTLRALWWRDLTHFLGRPSHSLGALGQSLALWLLLGVGLATSVVIPNLDPSVTYLDVLYPGAVVMVLILAASMASATMLRDRQEGLLQLLVGAPGSTAAVVLGKCLGAASAAVVLGAVFLGAAPAAGVPSFDVAWGLLLASLTAFATFVAAVSFICAWALRDPGPYRLSQMMLWTPMWLASGAMFPLQDGLVAALARLNPIAYMVSILRHALFTGGTQASLTLSDAPWSEVVVLAFFAVLSLATAVVLSDRRR